MTDPIDDELHRLEEELGHVLDVMRAPTPVDDVDLTARVLANATRARSLKARAIVPWSLAAAAASLVVLFLVARPADDGFRAKGDARVRERDGVACFVDTGGALVDVRKRDNQLHASDGLAFALTGPGGSPWVSIFAVDGAGTLFWYYPAAAGSIRAKPGELPDVVRQELRPGPLHLHAWFTDEPVDARAVAAALAAGGAAEGWRTIELEVLP